MKHTWNEPTSHSTHMSFSNLFPGPHTREIQNVVNCCNFLNNYGLILKYIIHYFFKNIFQEFVKTLMTIYVTFWIYTGRMQNTDHEIITRKMKTPPPSCSSALKLPQIPNFDAKNNFNTNLPMNKKLS